MLIRLWLFCEFVCILIEVEVNLSLQVDEIVNISQPLRQRYKTKTANAGFHRCLKLSMTDGVQRVFGMEYQPIKDLDVLAPAGLKVRYESYFIFFRIGFSLVRLFFASRVVLSAELYHDSCPCL